MKKFIQEFKAFAFRGNVIDMSVGIVIGSAFTGIVTSVVNDLITPLIGVLTGGIDLSFLGITLGEGENAPFLAIGNFIQTIVNFLIVAFCIFVLVKGVNRLKKPEPPKKAARKCPYCKSEIADDATRCPHCTSQL